MYGPDVETLVQEEDAQLLTEPIVAPIKVRKWVVQEKNMPETRYDKRSAKLRHLPRVLSADQLRFQLPAEHAAISFNGTERSNSGPSAPWKDFVTRHASSRNPCASMGLRQTSKVCFGCAHVYVAHGYLTSFDTPTHILYPSPGRYL